MIDDDVSNRSELIKRARESCSRSLVDGNTYPANYKVFRTTRNDNTKIGNEVLKVKFFVIRVVIALVILLSVIFIDQLKITYQNFSSNQISNMLHSNHLYAMAKGYVDMIFNDESKENDAKNSENNISETQNNEITEDKTNDEENTEDETQNVETKGDETQEVLNIDN